jgi:hypothetical protein
MVKELSLFFYCLLSEIAMKWRRIFRKESMSLRMLPLLASMLILEVSLLAGCGDTELIRKESQDVFPGWKTNVEKLTIDLSELISGGPPKDGIPSIDNPQFVAIEDANQWLEDKEPVITVEIDDDARAYPLQILIWHEIVNDEIHEIPITVTFCPLCYSALVFDRNVDGTTYTFGVSGMLRHSDLVMYDRETESLWQQVTGEAIVGDMTGSKLREYPAQIISFNQFSKAFPDGKVLSRETGYSKRYGQNPYIGYDDISSKPFMFHKNEDKRLPPMEKVVTVSLSEGVKAYPHSATKKLRVIHDVVGGKPLVIFHDNGAVSALDNARISSSREIGSTGVFNPQVQGKELKFSYIDGKFIDENTGSIWDITGKAVEGELNGARLDLIPHGDYFAFAWFAFRPETEIFMEGIGN